MVFFKRTSWKLQKLLVSLLLSERTVKLVPVTRDVLGSTNAKTPPDRHNLGDFFCQSHFGRPAVATWTASLRTAADTGWTRSGQAVPQAHDSGVSCAWTEICQSQHASGACESLTTHEERAQVHQARKPHTAGWVCGFIASHARAALACSGCRPGSS